MGVEEKGGEEGERKGRGRGEGRGRGGALTAAGGIVAVRLVLLCADGCVEGSCGNDVADAEVDEDQSSHSDELRSLTAEDAVEAEGNGVCGKDRRKDQQYQRKRKRCID